MASTEGAEEFEDALSRFQGLRHCITVSSGTAALCAAFASARQLTHRDKVAIPAYCCPSVLAAAVKSGLRVRFYDIAPGALMSNEKDLEDLPFSDLAAIVSIHHFGVQDAAIKRITELASGKGALVVEDIAQGLGARMHGARVGCAGDLAICSFARGKPLPLLGGGAVLTNDSQLAEHIRNWLAQHAQTSDGSAGALCRMAAYSALVRPRLYWIPAAIPWTQIGKTVYPSHIPIGRMSSVSRTLGVAMLRRLDERNTAARARALKIASILAEVPGIRVLKSEHSGAELFLRLPLYVAEAAVRSELVDALSAYGATAGYPLALPDMPEGRNFEERPCRNARDLCSRLLTLPTHEFVTEADILAIARIFKRICQHSRG